MDDAHLDQRIVEAIKAGRSSFTAIFLHINEGKVFKIDPDYIPERVIDKRLKAMHRGRRVIFTGSHTRTAWKLPQETTA